MTRRRGRRFAALAVCAIVLTLALADVAGAEPVPAWSGTKGPFAWEAKRQGCGIVGRSPSVVRAHTRWRTSPAAGYARLTFRRQIRDEDTGAWSTVQRQRRSTKNTGLEGERGVVHWKQWFFPFAGEGGVVSRHIVVFEWLRDRRGPDRLVLKRQRVFRPCTVAP
jgi:hypothetical protein